MPLAVDELLTITAAREAALSPTGDAVAFVISAVEGEREVARVGLVEAGAEVRLLAEGRGPAWSPAGDALVYATAAEVRRFDLRDGSDRPIASFATPPGRPRFSPRGDRIAVPVGRSGLAVVALDGAVETIEADLGVDIVAPSWSPDGETLVFGSARPGGGGVGPTSRIERWRPGGAPAAVETGLAYATCPSFSPDGETLALIGVPTPRLGLPDPGLRPWLVPAAGGTAAPAGDGPEGVVLEPVPVGPVWAPAGGALYLRLARRGAIDLVRIDLAGGASTTLTGGSQVVDFSLAGERLAVAAIAPDDPGSIHLLDVFGGEVARRSVWESPSAGRGVAVPAPRSFAAPDGTELDGWVAGVDPARGPQPTLLAFHGGPHGFFGPGFQRGHFYRDVLASHGWIVLTVNSTGSGSRGAAFADRLRGCWGERDLPEQLAALDQLIAEGVADPTRLAVAGYSYGGYLAAWTITHVKRFAAAVIGAPITDLESFERASDIGNWYTPWQMNGGLPENQDRYRRLSPAAHAGAVTTPTLILHGEADRRVPFAQGALLRDRLVAAGTPVELVAYPGADHLFYSAGEPAERLDFNRRVFEWLEANVDGGGERA